MKVLMTYKIYAEKKDRHNDFASLFRNSCLTVHCLLNENCLRFNKSLHS